MCISARDTNIHMGASVSHRPSGMRAGFYPLSRTPNCLCDRVIDGVVPFWPPEAGGKRPRDMSGSFVVLQRAGVRLVPRKLYSRLICSGRKQLRSLKRCTMHTYMNPIGDTGATTESVRSRQSARFNANRVLLPRSVERFSARRIPARYRIHCF